jgi:hypothetical protein
MPPSADTAQPQTPKPFCFVVMPYGTKPFNDGSGKTFDFEKVYRVVIERAVREAGLEPIRADQEKSSAIIHEDMFKSLRDNPIVLADLSLENPNVFYELGIRHVMSSKGTVLMCREGSMLPFDVRLSRVIFYKYDGVSFDWEEVEKKVVPSLTAALIEAQKGRRDSPVHALLERVLPDGAGAAPSVGKEVAWASGHHEILDPYQELVAACWITRKTPLPQLKKLHIASPFGCRALAYYCLRKKPFNSGEARNLTRDLYDVEQYDLVNRIFQRLLEEGVELKPWELMRYGSSLSEAGDQSAAKAREGLKYTQQALDQAEQAIQAGGPTPELVSTAFHAAKNASGLHFWLWFRERSVEELEKAIAAMEAALKYAAAGETLGKSPQVGHLAQAHLKQMLMLRVRENRRDRPDTEGHGDAVMRVQPHPSAKVNPEDRVANSYLRWYQAITLADRGDGQRANDLAMANVRDDARIMDLDECRQVGRRQYTHLRRFIEQYSPILRNVDLVARISQILQQFRQQAG